jgi:hypothetical protein
MRDISRRSILLGGISLVGAGALVAISSPTTAQATPPQPLPTTWSGRTSANGWPVVESAITRPVEGANVAAATAEGAPALILNHVARRFNYEIDTLLPDEIQGWTTNTTISQPYESNYLSGTAIAIRPGAYPMGTKGGFYVNELIVIRDILAECDGIVRWGGDEEIAKESHFQIDAPPNDQRIKKLTEKITGWAATPGEGPGTVDPFLAHRRRAAEKLEERQSND